MSTDPTLEAIGVANAFAAANGLSIRPLTRLAELEGARSLFANIARNGTSGVLLSDEALLGLFRAGNYISGAFAGPELVGASLAFFGPPGSQVLHGFRTSVSSGQDVGNVTFALKLHQRAWALMHGVSEIRWTFDPLDRRHAYLSLGRLAARPEKYLRDFYGRRENSDLDLTDRLLVRWRLQDPEVEAACRGEGSVIDTHHARQLNMASAIESGAPIESLLPQDLGQTLLVATPADIEAMRAEDPALALRWRCVLRSTLEMLLERGARITGFHRQGSYVLSLRGM